MSSLKELSRSLTRYGLKVSDAEEFASILVDVLNEGLRTDKQVKVKGLGTFKVTSVSSRESVNVNTGERIVLDGHDKISFTPDATMRDIVNAPFAQFETVNIDDDTDISKLEEPVVEEAPVAEELEKPAVEETAVPKTEATVVDAPPVVEEKTAPTVSGSVAQPTDKPKAEPVVEETHGVKETKVETVASVTTKVADEEPVKAVAQPAKAETVKPATVAVVEQPTEEEHAEIAEEETDNEKTEKRSFLVPLLFSLIILILLGGGFAIYRLMGELNRSNERLDSLIIQLNSNKQAAKPAAQVDTLSVATQPTENVKTDEILAEQAKAQKAAEEKVRKAAAEEAAKQKASATQPAPQQKATKAKSVAEEPVNVQPEKLSLLEKAKIKAAALKRATQKGINDGKQKVNDAKESLVGEHDKYVVANNYDARVRTGAYKIVGISHIVKVKPGQTLTSISRTYLGPGMECYLEAVNGTSTFKEGQIIKIPELKLKKK